MVDPLPEPIDVLHPLLGRRSPDLASLVERADSRARRVLVAARRLCRRRMVQQRQLEDQVDALDVAVDGLGLAPRLTPGTPFVARSDLLRALVALEPERMAAPFGDDLRAEPFAELVERQTRSLDDAPEPGEDDALEPGWARRWALADERHGTPRVTVPLLVASLGTDGLSQLERLSEVFVEGLVTRHEVGVRFVAYSDDDVAERVFTPVPPAYLDRAQGLRALEEGLRSRRAQAREPGSPHARSCGRRGRPAGLGRARRAAPWTTLSPSRRGLRVVARSSDHRACLPFRPRPPFAQL